MLAAFLVNLVPSATLVLTRTFDAETHLFFADHYASGWFSGWEPRWYGGFWVYSYPPLLHQLVALVGKLTDLDTAYRCVQLGVLTALPLSVWLLTDAIADARAAGWAAAFSVASAGVYSTVYSFGQLPTLSAVVLMFAATAFLVAWIMGGKPVDLVAFTGLGGACVATHHLTGIVGLPLLAVTSLLWLAVRCKQVDDPPRITCWKRAGVAALALFIVASVVLAPFLWWSRNGKVAQAEIAHPTRTAFLSDPAVWWLLVPGEWGVMPLMMPLLLWASWRRRELWAWTGLVALLATLSLGPAYTALPRLMFGGLSYWLTYERFALWGALVALVPFGVWAAGKRVRPLSLTLLMLFGYVALQAATYTVRTPIVDGLDTPALVPVVANWLTSHGRDRWRYVTFGFAEGDMPHLSRLTTATTIDGTYFTARRDPLLSRSGMGCVDTVTSQSPAMMNYIRVVLSAPQGYNLRWAVCAKAACADLLRRAQWACLGTLKPTGLEPCADPHHPSEDGVTVWMAPKRCNVPPFDSEPPSAPAALALVWGVVPVGLLVLGIGAAAKSPQTVDQAASSDEPASPGSTEWR
mgnify:CR=1 FL=1